jgi:hypothetical protein
MKEQALEKFVTTMTDILQSAKDFTLEQGPEIFRQVVAFAIGKSIFYVLIATIIMVIAWKASKPIVKEIRREKKAYDMCDPDITIPLGLIVAFGSVGGGVLFVANAEILIQATVAPKLYLIEYFAKLVR